MRKLFLGYAVKFTRGSCEMNCRRNEFAGGSF